MSAGGHMSTMLSSIKNNSKRKHKTIFEGNGGFDQFKSRNPFVSPKNASKEEILKLRIRLKEEKKNGLIIASFIAISTLALISIVVVYLVF